MKTNQKTIWDVINEKHTEFCGGSGIGYDMEQLENEIIDDTISSLKIPTLSEILAFTPLEDMRNSDEESADDLLKKAIENWIGAKCLDALAASEKFNVNQSYLESLSVSIELGDDWKSWII